MTFYVRIYYDKTNKTQRFVLTNWYDCNASVERKLKEHHINFTNHKWLGAYEKFKDYKSQTYKYAQKWQWLNTIDLRFN